MQGSSRGEVREEGRVDALRLVGSRRGLATASTPSDCFFFSGFDCFDAKR